MSVCRLGARGARQKDVVATAAEAAAELNRTALNTTAFVRWNITLTRCSV